MQVLQSLIDAVRAACAGFPDKRRGGGVTYSMSDIGLSAFSLFFMQSGSFLSHQRGLEEAGKTSNCQSLFGMRAVPTDNHIRAMLNPVAEAIKAAGGAPPSRHRTRRSTTSWMAPRSRNVRSSTRPPASA